jgi:hypothetical protein
LQHPRDTVVHTVTGVGSCHEQVGQEFSQLHGLSQHDGSRAEMIAKNDAQVRCRKMKIV